MSSGSNDIRRRLVVFFKKYDPEKVASIEQMIQKIPKGHEDKVMEALVKKYGPEPKIKASEEDREELRERLKAYYTHYDKSKLASLETLVMKYVGIDHELFDALERKYGPENVVEGHAERQKKREEREEKLAAASPESKKKKPKQDNEERKAALRARLERYYNKYDKSKLSDVEKLVAKYTGNEGALFKALCGKYGPEPPADDDGDDEAPATTAQDPQPAAQEKVVQENVTTKTPPEEKDASEKEADAPPAAATASPLPQKEKKKSVHFDEAPPKQEAVEEPPKQQPQGGTKEKAEPVLVGVETVPETKQDEPSAKAVGDNCTNTSPSTDASPANEGQEEATNQKASNDDEKQEQEQPSESNPTAVEGALGKEEPQPTQTKEDAVQAPKEEDTSSANSAVVAGAAAAPPSQETKKEEASTTIPQGEMSAGGTEDSPKPSEEEPGEQTQEQQPSSSPRMPPAEAEALAMDPDAPLRVPARIFPAHVRRLYGSNCPEQLQKVSVVLEAYTGRENALLAEMENLGWSGVAQNLDKDGLVMPEKKEDQVDGEVPTTQNHGENDADVPQLKQVTVVPAEEDATVDDEEQEQSTSQQDAAANNQTANQLGNSEPHTPTQQQQQQQQDGAMSTPTRQVEPPSPPPRQPQTTTTDDTAMQSYGNEYGRRLRSQTMMGGSSPASGGAPIKHSLERIRLLNFFRHYDPSRIQTVDQLLASNVGREQELIQELVQIHGPEPPPYLPTEEDKAQLREILQEFYTQHDPNRVAEVDKLSHKYCGMEVDLFSALFKKYGVAPRPFVYHRSDKTASGRPPVTTSTPPPQYPTGGGSSDGHSSIMYASTMPEYAQKYSTRARSNTIRRSANAHGKQNTLERVRLLNFFRRYEPASIKTVDQLLAKNVGREDKLLKELTQIYGPEPPPYLPTEEDRAQLREILQEYYTKHDSSRVHEVDKLAHKYSGMEADLFSALQEKYGVAPRPFIYNRGNAADDGGGGVPQPKTETRVCRDTLHKFFKKHDPTRADQLPDATLMAFKGRNEVLFEVLKGKFKEDLKKFAKVRQLPLYEEVIADDDEDENNAEQKTPRGRSISAAPGSPQPHSPQRTASKPPAATAPTDPEEEWKPGPHDKISKPTLSEYFQKHDSKRAEALPDATLKAFAGRNEVLLKVLKSKYGEPVEDFAKARRLPLYEGQPVPEPEEERGRSKSKSVAMTRDRRRVMDFFRAYNKDRMKECDDLLGKIAGPPGSDPESTPYDTIDDLIAALEQEYGPEPPPFEPTEEDYDELADRIARYYEKYEPSKVPDAKKMAAKYCGLEPDLFGALEAKYGPEPPFDDPQRHEALSYNRDGAPGSRPLIGTSRLHHNHALAANEPLQRLTNRIVNFYNRYDKPKIATAGALARQFLGRENLLFKDLESKYGPEPLDATDPTVVDALRALEKRLERFYKHYDPSKISNVPVIAAQFVGKEKEEQLFKALEAKYGPEEFMHTDADAEDGDQQQGLGTTSRSINPAASPAKALDTMTTDEKLLHCIDRSRMYKYIIFHDILSTMPEGTTPDAAVTSLLGFADGSFTNAMGLLQIKYGKEPMATSAVVGPEEQELLSARLTKYFMSKSLPVSAQFVLEGNDLFSCADYFFEELEKVFGPEFKISPKLQRRLKRFYQHYAPSKLGDVDADLLAHKGNEDEMFRLLTRVYGPEPEVDRMKRYVTKLYQYNCPDQLHKVDTVLEAYKGNENALLLELESLGWKLPPGSARPDESSDDDGDGGASRAALARLKDRRDRRALNKKRLRDFFDKHDPGAKTDEDINVMLSAYDGREDILFADLEKHYGAAARQAFVAEQEQRLRGTSPSQMISVAPPTPPVPQDDKSSQQQSSVGSPTSRQVVGLAAMAGATAFAAGARQPHSPLPKPAALAPASSPAPVNRLKFVELNQTSHSAVSSSASCEEETEDMHLDGQDDRVGEPLQQQPPSEGALRSRSDSVATTSSVAASNGSSPKHTFLYGKKKQEHLEQERRRMAVMQQKELEVFMEQEERQRSEIDFSEYEAASTLRSECRTMLEEQAMLERLTVQLTSRGRREADVNGMGGGDDGSVSMAKWYDALSPYFQMAMDTSHLNPRATINDSLLAGSPRRAGSASVVTPQQRKR